MAAQKKKKSSALCNLDYERAHKEFCGKYVIAYYNPREKRSVDGMVGWYVGTGIPDSLSHKFPFSNKKFSCCLLSITTYYLTEVTN